MDNLKFYRFLDKTSILVIDKQKQLRRLNCPFAVKDKKGKIKRVTAVTTETGRDIKYLIDGVLKPHSGLKIMC